MTALKAILQHYRGGVVGGGGGGVGGKQLRTLPTVILFLFLFVFFKEKEGLFRGTLHRQSVGQLRR